MGLPGRGTWPPMLWIGGGQGAGKTILSWELSRASDLPLHRVDMWTYEETLAGRPVAGRSRTSLVLQRDAILTSRIRESAVLAGRPVIEVPPHPDWPVIAAAIESALAPALGSAPRLAPGGELSRQRRYENKAADRQGRLWMQDAGLSAMPPYPFGCECGKSMCRATWTATPDDYAARATSERRLIAHA